MRPESLQALLLDRELGELPAETVELLEAWLAAHPESATSVPALRRTLETTQAAIRRFPELARPEPGRIASPVFRWRLVPLALAASLVLVFGGSAWLGFRAGRQAAQPGLAGNDPTPGTVAPVEPRPSAGPWARYALASGPRGGLTVVRRDLNP